MIEYNPVTESVCERWMRDRFITDDVDTTKSRAEFNRWLEQERAEAKAEALREAADAFEADPNTRDTLRLTSDWFRIRANQYKEHQVHEASPMLQKLVEMVQAHKDYIVPTRAQVEALYQEAANQGHGLMIVEGKPGTLRIAPGAVPGELIVVNPEALA